MTGVLLVDKPTGPTSHDVVARLRQVTRERSIGHAGTLDPRATGLLVMLLGKATRLAPLLSGHDKVYEATVRLGWATTTDDADGERLERLESGEASQLPTAADLNAALDHFRGRFEQMPPQFSAKKVDGHKAYDMARRDQYVPLKTSTVTVKALDLIERKGDLVQLRVTATAGFYVRSLARDLGTRLGCGAHLHDLRRTQSGAFSVAAATPLEEAERLGPDVSPRLVSMAEALPELPSIRLSDGGLVRVRHGNAIGPQFVVGAWVPATAGAGKVRLLDDGGGLVALADLRGGLLHPSVVLG